MEPYRSRVYTDRPAYADYDAPDKFQAIIGIIMTHLREHPNAMCSYSGGSDSDILIDLIETARQMVPSLPVVKYVFFNTGLEMKAIKDHVKATEQKYGVKIQEIRPDVPIVTAVRRYGVPFVSKIMSGGLEQWQKKDVPLSIVDEYNAAEDKHAIRMELKERYPGCEQLINFLCCCNRKANPDQTFSWSSTHRSICSISSGRTRPTSGSRPSAAITARSAQRIRCRRMSR